MNKKQEALLMSDARKWQSLHEELQATERQLEILSDALAESRKFASELLIRLKEARLCVPPERGQCRTAGSAEDASALHEELRSSVELHASRANR